MCPAKESDEEKKKREEKEREEIARLIKRDILDSGIEMNVAAPPDIGHRVRDSIAQEIPADLQMDSPAQMEAPIQSEAPPETESYAPIPLEPPKPRNKVLVKSDELLAEARKLIKEHKYELAIQRINERINLLKKTEYKYDYARTFFYGGQTLNEIGQHSEAKHLLEQGIEALKGTSYETGSTMAGILVELGIAYRKLGKYNQALEKFNQAADFYKKDGNQRSYINTLYNKGIVFYDIKDWKSAIEVYLEIAKASEEDPEEMSARLKSLQRVADVISLAESAGSADFDSDPYLRQIKSMKGDYEKALAHELRRAAKGRTLEDIQAEQAKDPSNLALWHFNLAAAEITASSGDLSVAKTNYNKAIELYKELGDKLGLSRCYHHLAYIKEKEGDLKEAVSLLRECIKLREDLKESMKLEEYRTAIHAETIPLYDDLSYLEAKLKNYQASLNAIEQSKSRELINHLANESLNTCPFIKNLLEEEEKTLGKLRDLEQDLYDFGMRYSEDVRRGYREERMLEDRKKLEQQIAELHNQLQDYRRDIWMKCIDTGNVKPPIEYDIYSNGMKIFQKEQNWAILEFIWNPRRAEIMVFFLTSEGMKLFQTSLDPKELKDMLNQYKTSLIEEDDNALNKSAQKFSEKIIPSQLFDELDATSNIQYLFIIPHKELHSIPFEVIQHKGQYWGQKYCIVKNFSLDLSRITLQKRIQFSEKHPKPKQLAVVVGNPTMDLPNAEVEAREVERMLKEKGFKVKLMMKKKSTEAAFTKEVTDKMIVHYAGHGIFITPEPILSHLIFTSSDLTAREITQLKLNNLPIVVLSACETAISGFLGGNELVGFVRSFILSGSTTIVTTNWPVHDESAQELICKFYENLLMGASVGIALQNARKFIAQKYNNQIVHWAAYTLFGDPFRRLIIS